MVSLSVISTQSDFENLFLTSGQQIVYSQYPNTGYEKISCEGEILMANCPESNHLSYLISYFEK